MTKRPHLRRALVDDYFRGQVPAGELAAEVARVLAGECEECREALNTTGAGYDRAMQAASLRARAGVEELEAERRHLPEALATLSRSWPEALVQVAAEERFHAVAFVEYEVEAAWAAVAGEDWRSARQATELAMAAAARLPVERYGRILVARLQAEAELVRARVAVATGHDHEARKALGAVEASGATAACRELEAGLLVARAVLALREGDPRAARQHLQRAADLAREGRAGRWAGSVAAMQRRLERGRTSRDRPGDIAAAWPRFRQLVTLGAGLKAMAVATELARGTVRDPETGPSPLALAEALEDLVARCDLPGEAVEALAEVATALARGTLCAEDLDELEDQLLELDPPWERASHERG